MARRRLTQILFATTLLLGTNAASAQVFAPNQARTPKYNAVGPERYNRKPNCRPARVPAFASSRTIVVLGYCNDPDVDPMVVVSTRVKRAPVLAFVNDDQTVTVSGLQPGAEAELDVEVADVLGKRTKTTIVVHRQAE